MRPVSDHRHDHHPRPSPLNDGVTTMPQANPTPLGVITSKHDECLAICRDWAEQRSYRELTKYAMRFYDAMKTEDEDEMLSARFALLGLMAAIISSRQEAERAE